MTGANVLVVDDRLQSGAALSQWLTAGGVTVAVSPSWAEAADTLAYQQLAGTPLPALLIGPLAKEGVTVLAALRGQGIDPRCAFYTESRARDQDEALTRQYRLVAILHKPFADEDRARLLGSGPSDDVDDLIGSRHLGSAPAAPPPRAEVALPATPPGPAAKRDAFDDLIGSSRGSSVKADQPPPKARTLKAEELPSGVQRLLVDPMAGQEVELPKKRGEEPVGSGPRSLAILAVEDKLGSARLLVERLGAPGQTTKAVPGYPEALSQLERMMMGSLGCELLIGPLSADGVAAAREYRKRGWPTHVVFYTESSTQSQDPRLPAQYGCLAIVRRAGMAEQLEKLVTELRAKPRQPPAVPAEAGARTSSGRAPAEGAAAPPQPAGGAPAVPSARRSGLHAVPQPAAPAVPAARRSGLHAVPQDSAPAAPGAGTGRIDTGTRLRRSIGSQAGNPPAAPTPGPAPLEIDSGEPPAAASAAAATRVFTCAKCRQEFVAAVKPLAKVTCPHCGTVKG